MTVGQQYREKSGTIEAFQYVGEFPLSFLRHDETVRASAGGSSAAVVSTPDGEVMVHRNDYVVREYRSGRLCALSPQRFRAAYEPIEMDRPACACEVTR